MSSNGKKQLASGWREAPLGDMLTILRGVSYKKQDATTEPAAGKIPILRATNIDDGKLNFTGLVYVPQEYVSKVQLLNVGDIVIAASSGSRHVVGKAASLTVPWTGSFGAFCYGLRPHLQGTASYISLFLQTSIYRDHVSELSAGININNLRREHIEGVPLPVAPLNEQRRIVAKIEELFSELDKGIESLKTARAQLNVYRQAVLKHAFEGKLTAQWREENKDKLETPEQLLARIKQEREARYEQQVQEWKSTVKTWEETGKPGNKKPAKPKPANDPSPIGQEDRERLLDLPDEWAWVRLGQLFSISPQNGIYKPTSEYGSGTQIIRIDDFYDGQLTRRTGFKKLRLSDEEIEKYKVRNSDLIINRVNSIEYLGKCALVESLTENTVFESNVMRCCVMEDVISKAYVAAYLASHEGRNRLCENAKHAVNQASVNQTDVGNTLVPITSMEEQLLIVQKIEQKLSQTDALISQIEGHLKKAEALRQSILKRAFAGQLVPQDPYDEPASVLLDRIRTEREKVMQNNHSKKTKKRKTTA